jgi:undecaprenyl-diphosphatase
MDLFQAVSLGILQGLTEFLPISSSGHLIVVPWILGWEEYDHKLTFDVALHFGTFLAVVGYFWQDLWRITRTFFKKAFCGSRSLGADPDSRLFLMLIIGSIPAGFLGLLFDDYIETVLRSPLITAFTLIGVGMLLWWGEKRARQDKTMAQIRWRDALLIGLAQATALIPGVSRSGATITAGLWQGLDKVTAARFSFILATPVVAGASVFKLKDIIGSGLPPGEAWGFVLGTAVAAISGWLAIKYLLAFIQNHSYKVFVWYRVVLGLLIISLTFLR